MAIGSVIIVPEEGGSGMSNDQDAKSYFIENIEARDGLIMSPSARGSQALVEDASEDPNVESGGALYFWSGTEWIMVARGDKGDIGPEVKHIVKDSVTLNDGNVALDVYKDIYKITVAADTAFTFDVSNLGDLTNKVVTFELHVDMTTVSVLTFPASVDWLDEPLLNLVGKYVFVFRSIDGGTNWLGNLAYEVLT